MTLDTDPPYYENSTSVILDWNRGKGNPPGIKSLTFR